MLTNKKTKFIVYTGVMAALSIILYFIEFPIIPGSNYLMIDASDLPAAIAGIILGPGAAVAVELIKVLFHVIVKGMGSTMGFGDLINFIVGVAVTVPFSAVYRAAAKRFSNKFTAMVLAGISGLVSMAAVGVVANYFIAPPYFEFFLHFKLTPPALWAAIGSATILNIVKSILIAVVMIPIITLLNKKVIKI
ncbi:MAG TPA: ECF transporter S component [Ruminiclostridium sp.]|nr:ECF transporter S component [Ruminiclostridium sp.]